MEVGIYCKNNQDTLLAEKIDYVIFHNFYEQFCCNAHNAVEIV